MEAELILDIEKLEKDITEQRNQLSTDRMDISFGELMNMYEANEIIIKPAFQRYFRWDDEQKTRFIESILLGIPIPPIFVAENEHAVWELVDGLQRISTILSFFGFLKSEDNGIKEKNNWTLLEGDRVDSLAGFTIDTLPSKFKLQIKRATCRVEIIRWNSNYDMRFELFNRLNTGGSNLNSQEIRNAIYRDISPKFNDFLKKLAELPEFLDLIALSDEQKEQLFHEELVLRFLSLYKNRKNVKSSISQHMTSFMENALKDKNFAYDELEDVFVKVVKKLNPLGKTIFRQSDRNFATALYDTIMIGVAENFSLYESESEAIIQSKIDNEVRNDATLKKFSRKGGNNQKDRILNRLKEANRIFGEL